MRQFLEFEVLENGNLKISLTEEGKEELQEMMDLNRDYWWMWSDLMEYSTCNGSYALVTSEEVGALTDSPIITDERNIDDDGKLIETPYSKYWWFPNYMVINELEELLKEGSIIFTTNSK